MDSHEVFIPIVLFLSIFGIVYVAISARHRERMSLIDKGLDASILYPDHEKKGRFGALKFGLLLIGAALGLLVGSLLATYTDMKEQIAYFSMFFLFGGLGLVSFYFFVKNSREA
jgi:NADH:ubiquinone oxidoreductase subunit 4 (subunit M)